MSKVSDVKDILILGGVGLAAYTVYKNKDQIGGFFGGIGAGFNNFTDSLGKFGSDLSNSLGNLGGIIADSGQQTINVVVQAGETVKETIEDTPIIQDRIDKFQEDPFSTIAETISPGALIIDTVANETSSGIQNIIDNGVSAIPENIVNSTPVSIVTTATTGKNLATIIQEAIPDITSNVGSAVKNASSTALQLLQKLQGTSSSSSTVTVTSTNNPISTVSQSVLNKAINNLTSSLGDATKSILSKLGF